MSPTEHFRAKLRELRLSRGLSYRGLSKISGYHRSTIRRIETGEWEPKLQMVSDLAEALGVPLAEMIGVTDEISGSS